MHRIINLYLEDGELVEYQLCVPGGRDCRFELYWQKLLDIDFIFFNSDGTPLPLWFAGDPLKVQTLLSYQDRLLASQEQETHWVPDQYGSSVLPLKNIAFNEYAAKQFMMEDLSRSSWLDCEFSAAVYSGSIPNFNMQLFFTFNTRVFFA
jgi:hypothetical protein